MSKELKITIVSFEEFSSFDFLCPATFFCMDSMQNYIYFHTSDRKAAQDKCDELFGVGHYVVKTSKTVKTKSRREDGGYSAVGSNTRKGFASQLKKTI